MADNKQNLCSYCFYFLLIFIILYTRKIYDNTKNDPLKKPLNENRTIYFKNITEIFTPYEKQCVCGDEVLNDFCTEEQILSGCHEKTLNKQQNTNLFLRFLMSNTKCKEYENKIRNYEIQSLSEIFDINAGKINNMAFGILVSTIVTMCLAFILSIIPCFFIKCDDKFHSVSKIVQMLIVLLCIISFIINLILFIILCVQYNKGDTADYVSFLTCNNIEKKSFKEFDDAEDLKSNYKSFLIVNIIYYVLSAIYIVCSILMTIYKDEDDD